MARALILVAAAAAALAPAARRSHVSRREILGFGASAAIAVAAPPARAASGVARPRGNRLLREAGQLLVYCRDANSTRSAPVRRFPRASDDARGQRTIQIRTKQELPTRRERPHHGDRDPPSRRSRSRT